MHEEVATRTEFEAVIGLEVHVQLLTQSKMFCGCENRYGGLPNSRTCPVCLGLPGALPALNGEAVRMAIALGLALKASIREESTFYRKQYFYPDLPKGYQITQGPVALVEEGWLEIPGDATVRGREGALRVRIERAHLEEDAGKSSHDLDPDHSLVDLNRAGVPLLEIVGGPDLRSPQEASDYLKAIHHLVMYLGICDGNMDEGSLRCDANISVRRRGETKLGTRVEVKNLNSFRFLRQALEFEIDRQIELVESGQPFSQETRGWDAQAGVTRSQRSKEAAMDYRHFPEPDLPVLCVSPEEVAGVRAHLPELPSDRKARFQETFGLTDYEADMLVQTPMHADYFESVATLSGNGKQAANWMLGEVSRSLNETGHNLETLGLSSAQLADLIKLVATGTINLNTAKEIVFPGMLAGEGNPADIVATKSLGQVSDHNFVTSLVRDILTANPQQLAQYKAGKVNLRGFFVGQAMKAGQGRINPQVLNQAVDEALASEEAP
ncbi:MAG: Asp-tRNA(Asn)/Glu-tRNA(Gln) amidotransferase subunit GatB [Holophaga sp.]|nr:Asp-tRNA(Asn)/Glu-tRNA(Gln) amidotransferase subunit GatB [Holophaga sp.]